MVIPQFALRKSTTILLLDITMNSSCMYSSAIIESSFKLEDWIKRCTKDKNTISQVRRLWSDLGALSACHETPAKLRKRTTVRPSPTLLMSKVFDEEGRAILDRLRSDVRARYGNKLRRMWTATLHKAIQLVHRRLLKINMTARMGQQAFDELLQEAVDPLRALILPTYVNQLVDEWDGVTAVFHPPTGRWGVSLNGIGVYLRCRLFLTSKNLEEISCPITPGVLNKMADIPSFRFDGPDPAPGLADLRHYWMWHSKHPNGDVTSTPLPTPDSNQGFIEWDKVKDCCYAFRHVCSCTVFPCSHMHTH